VLRFVCEPFSGKIQTTMHSRKTILLAVVLTFAFGATRILAQDAASPAPPTPQIPSQASTISKPAQGPGANLPPTAKPLRSTSRLVQLSVVVHDKQGNPITGLTKDDFVIVDGKKPQPIQIFSVQTNQASNLPAQELPADTYTNRLQARGGAPPNVTIILLDALNTSFMDKAFVRQRLVKYLQTIQPQDRVALYSLGSRLRILHDFTSDASSLLVSLQKFKDDVSPEIDLSDFDLSGDPYKRLGGPSDDMDRMQGTVNVVQITVEALREIADHVRALPGRKNLIWLSGSFPFSISSENMRLGTHGEHILFATEIELVARALSDANVSIYPVDARGLIPTDIDGPGGNPFRSSVMPDFGTMLTLAERTGGRAYFNTNDIMGSVRQAIDDSRVTYEVGIVPQDVKWDGSFHRLRVSVNRKDAQVRARTGYFASEDSGEAPQTHVQLIAQTAMSPVEATGIEMNVHVEPGEAVLGATLKMDLAFDAGQLEFRQDKDGLWNAVVETAFVELDERGKMLASTLQPFPLHIDTAAYERLLKEGLTYTHEMLIVPGAVHIRVILRDGATGKIGSVDLPLAQYFPAKVN
jgi:VWFA-related protein